jgi:hypothetical protein
MKRKTRYAGEKNRKKVGVPEKLWKCMGAAGTVACSRMWDDLTKDGGVWMAPDTPKLTLAQWRVLRYNMAVTAGMVVREMKKDEEAGIALWSR